MLKTLGLVLSSAAVLSGCDAAPSAVASAPVDTHLSALQSDPAVVGAPSSGSSACAALYASPQARAALTQAVVEPGLAADGLVKTLILSFNTQRAATSALSVLRNAPGLNLAPGKLGSFRTLPMVVLQVPVTPALLTTLRTMLQPLGLLSIYQDRPLRLLPR